MKKNGLTGFTRCTKRNKIILALQFIIVTRQLGSSASFLKFMTNLNATCYSGKKTRVSSTTVLSSESLGRPFYFRTMFPFLHLKYPSSWLQTIPILVGLLSEPVNIKIWLINTSCRFKTMLSYVVLEKDYGFMGRMKIFYIFQRPKLR